MTVTSRAGSSQTATLPAPPAGLTLFIYALACGVMVGNLYVCQPLLDEIARSFQVPERVAGLVSVAAQLGYGLGILLLVPLADIARPRRLLRWLIVATSAGLLVAAAAPTIAVLIAASLAFAAATVVPQILVPLASAMVAAERRGRVIATLQTGFVLGILLSRTISGAIAYAAGSWRAPFLFAAVATGVLSAILPRYLPIAAPAQSRSYGALLRSLPPLLRLPPLRMSAALGFCLFGAFSAFWSTLAFHLAGPPFGLGVAATGLFGLWGAPGAILAPVMGRLADRIGPWWINAFSLACGALAFALAGLVGRGSLWALVGAVNLLDLGLQSGQIANQTRIFKLGDDIRARLNTVYMVGVFGGGAVGSLAGTLAWHAAGWAGVCGLAGGLVAVAAVGLVGARHSAGRPGAA